MRKQSNIDSVEALFEEKSKFIENKHLRERDVERKYIFRLSKRLIDMIGSAIGLIMLSPLFLIVAIAIKKEEKGGSVFFSQIRVGKNGKEFKMYKFRSMCLNAESMLASLLKLNEVEGAMFKIKEDPRVTKIGRIIRRTSIDELPQLWNVLRGDMSLVGPRPPLAREVAQYTTYDKQRLLVKPGCTGIWQISGRNDVSFYDMVQLDIKYVQQQSIILDIKIIVKTVWIMIKPRGAY